MAFYGIMLVRDEGDMMAETLEHLLTWIDGLFVLDLGSLDETWDVLNDFAARDKRVVPWRREPYLFKDNLRGMIFDQFRHRFRKGDWVLRVDADEIYHVPPPVFVKERLGPLETAAHLQWYFFRLTSAEVAAYESGRVSIAEDRKRPVQERRRFYKITDYPEPRMFMYRPSIRWPESISFPYNAGFVARERLPIRHYPHRDPLQMQRRFKLRHAMLQLKGHAGHHWKLEDWRKEVVDSAGASSAMQTREGLAGVEGCEMGGLIEWKPGTPLVEQRAYNHVPSFGRRLMQRIVHPLLLPLLDSRRPSFSKTFAPELLPEEITANVYR